CFGWGHERLDNGHDPKNEGHDDAQLPTCVLRQQQTILRGPQQRDDCRYECGASKQDLENHERSSNVEKHADLLLWLRQGASSRARLSAQFTTLWLTKGLRPNSGGLKFFSGGTCGYAHQRGSTVPIFASTC